MRIAFLTDGIWPFVIGGMQKHSYYICKYISRNKIYIDLYHPINNSEYLDLKKVFSDEELPYISLHLVQNPKTDRFPGHYIRYSKKYSEALYNKFKKNRDVDLIYAKGLTSWVFLQRKKRGEILPKICINVHGYEYYQKAGSFRGILEQFILRPPFRFVNESSDFIYSYGGKITEIIKQKLNQNAEKIIEIPTGIEEDFLVSRIRDLRTKRQLVFLGRNEERKGIKDINKAIISLACVHDFEFHFIGAIPKSEQLNVGNVVYHGVLNDINSIKKILSNSDLLVCPSYSEGMPNVILEAMGCGCAIIASDVGAIAVLVDAKNGWLITPGYQSLRIALIEALNIKSQELMKKRQQSLVRIRENFLWNDISERLISSFRQILRY